LEAREDFRGCQEGESFAWVVAELLGDFLEASRSVPDELTEQRSRILVLCLRDQSRK
jgi:hypothetical protein